MSQFSGMPGRALGHLEGPIIFMMPVPQYGPNGDRDTQRHPYNDYAIHILRGDEQPNEANCIHIVRGYDHFQSHILDKDVVLAEATAYAQKLWDRVGGMLKIGGKNAKLWHFTIDVLITAEDSASAHAIFAASLKKGEYKHKCEEFKR